MNPDQIEQFLVIAANGRRGEKREVFVKFGYTSSRGGKQTWGFNTLPSDGYTYSERDLGSIEYVSVYDPKTHTIVPKDAVVIEEGDAVLRNVGAIPVREILEAASNIVGSRTGYIGVKMKLDALVAQLTPSATTENEGGEKERVRNAVKKLHKDFSEEQSRQIDEDIANFKPTVTIELTEYDRINVDTAMKTMLLPVPLAEIIAKVYNAMQPLTPPRPEEPKGFGIIVEAKDEDDGGEHIWQKSIIDGLWYNKRGEMRRFIDLINPVVLSEGQVG